MRRITSLTKKDIEHTKSLVSSEEMDNQRKDLEKKKIMIETMDQREN